MKEKLRKKISEAKNKRTSPILGECIENAKFLRDFINKNTKYEAKIIKGAVDYENEPTPETYEQAKKNGTLHHWVLIDVGDEKYHCDLANEAKSYKYPSGNILVSVHKPPHYISF